MADCRYL